MNFDWDDLRILIAVDDAGTVLGAARALRLSHSTVQRRLDGAERALGAVLFRRRGGRLVRTDAAQELLDEARRIGLAVTALTRAAGSAEAGPGGVVRVAAPLALVTQLLARHLVPLRLSHPEIHIVLQADLGFDAMMRGEADIGLRVSMPVAEHLDIRRVCGYRFGLYASREVAEENLMALRRGEPLPGPYLAFSEDHPEVPENRWIREIFRGSAPVLKANTGLALATAAQAGWGVAALAEYIGATWAGLHRIPVQRDSPDEGLYLVTHREQRKLARIRVVVDLIERVVRSEFGRPADQTREMARTDC